MPNPDDAIVAVNAFCIAGIEGVDVNNAVVKVSRSELGNESKAWLTVVRCDEEMVTDCLEVAMVVCLVVDVVCKVLVTQEVWMMEQQVDS